MSEGPFDPADPEYELKVAEWYQRTVDGPRQGDDDPVVLTVRQAQKIAAIMDAVAHGYSSYVDALRAANWFLDCVVAEARPGRAHTSMTAAEAWARVDASPWPRPGAPKAAADQEQD